MDDERVRNLAQGSSAEIADVPGKRIYFIRVNIPSIRKVLATAVEVSEAYVDGEQVTRLREEQGIDRETAMAAVAIDSLRIRLQQAGFSLEQLEPAHLVEVRQVKAAEVKELIIKYAKAEGD